MLTRLALMTAISLAVALPAAAQTPFGGLSPEGRARLAAAMARDESPAHTAAIQRARQRVLDLLSADELDSDAIADAQEQERRLVMQEHARAHERMRDAYEDLSASDRKAFAAAVRLRQQRISAELARTKDRMQQIDQLMEYQMRRLAQARARQRQQGARQASQDQ